jgi:hypothetical protein
MDRALFSSIFFHRSRADLHSDLFFPKSQFRMSEIIDKEKYDKDLLTVSGRAGMSFKSINNQGGAYIPPQRLKHVASSITDKSTDIYQRISTSRPN